MQCTRVLIQQQKKTVWHVFSVCRCVHISYRCLWLWMARPRPSAPPVQTGSHPRAVRCVETWTASSWWSSSCPSSQFHHLGPTALWEHKKDIAINHHRHHLHPPLIITVAHQQWFLSVYGETTAVQPLLHLFQCVSWGCVRTRSTNTVG